MNEEYRIKKMKEACEILKEEFSKNTNERNVNRINHASSLIHLYAKKHEIPLDPVFEDEEEDDYYDYVPFDAYDFDKWTILEYADKMLKELKVAEKDETLNKRAELKQKKRDEEDAKYYAGDFFEIETRNAIRDYFEIGDSVSARETLDIIVNGMAGQTDLNKLKRVVNMVFRVVQNPSHPNSGKFVNENFVKRVWGSLTILQKRWLIKNNHINKDAITILKKLRLYT